MNVISHEEYEALLREEDGDLVPPVFIAQAFDPSDWVVEGFDWDTPDPRAVRVIRLNVSETSMYTGKDGKVIIVFPKGAVTYDMVNGFFPVKDAWLYTISDSVGSDLDERLYLFRYGKMEFDGNIPLPPFINGDTATH